MAGGHLCRSMLHIYSPWICYEGGGGVHTRLQMAFLNLFDVLQCVRPVGEVWLHKKYEGSSKQISSKLSRLLLLRIDVALHEAKPGAQRKAQHRIIPVEIASKGFIATSSSSALQGWLLNTFYGLDQIHARLGETWTSAMVLVSLILHHPRRHLSSLPTDFTSAPSSGRSHEVLRFRGECPS